MTGYLDTFVDLEMDLTGPGILNKVEPVWYEKDLPTTTHFENNNFKSKTIGDLKLKDGVKLI